RTGAQLQRGHDARSQGHRHGTRHPDRRGAGRPLRRHAQTRRVQDLDAAGRGGQSPGGARRAGRLGTRTRPACGRAHPVHRRAVWPGSPARTHARPLLSFSMAATPETTANPATSSTRALSITAFATLLLIACIMGANHVAARIAFNHGTDVATAVVFRSVVTTAVMVVLLLVQRVPLALTPRKRNALALIGLLVGLQSLFLYSAVARLPVALALLAFNSYPLWGALW